MGVLFVLLSTAAFAQGTSKQLAVLAKGAASDGAWKRELQFWPGSDKCAGTGKRDCGTEVFYIENNSDDVIECTGSIAYKSVRPQRQEFRNVEETGLVRVRLTLQKPDGATKFVKALTFKTTCAPTTYDMGIRFTIAE